LKKSKKVSGGLAGRCFLTRSDDLTAKKKEPAPPKWSEFLPVFPLRHHFPQLAFRRRRRGGGAGASLGPLAELPDLFGHELGERHKLGQHLGDGEVGRFGLPGERMEERINEGVLDFAPGQAFRGTGELDQVELVRVTPILCNLNAAYGASTIGGIR
jgi:hypothetical protein